MMMDRSTAKFTCQKQKAEHTKYAQCAEREFLHIQGNKNERGKKKAIGYFFFVLMRARTSGVCKFRHYARLEPLSREKCCTGLASV